MPRDLRSYQTKHVRSVSQPYCEFCEKCLPYRRLGWIIDGGYYCSSACAWAWLALAFFVGRGAFSDASYDNFVGQIKELWGA